MDDLKSQGLRLGELRQLMRTHFKELTPIKLNLWQKNIESSILCYLYLFSIYTEMVYNSFQLVQDPVRFIKHLSLRWQLGFLDSKSSSTE